MRSLYYTIICLALSVLVASCNHSTTNKCGPCPLYLYPEMIPNINFRVVDRTTSQDLFFGSGAPYKVSQLVMRQIINGKPDSADLRVDTVKHSFNVAVPPSGHVDMVTMQIANKTPDTLLFNTGNTGGCCPRLVFFSVSFDGAIIYTPADGQKVVVLAK